MMRGWSFGTTNKILAVGYGSDLGKVWAVMGTQSNPKLTIYKSTDYGATFSPTADTVTTSTNFVAPYLLSVPGYPGELWLACGATGGITDTLFHSKDSGDTWAAVARPTSPVTGYLPLAFSLGAPATPGGYPTLFGLFKYSYSATPYLYYGTYNTGTGAVAWNLLGSTGTAQDLPLGQQIAGIQSIRGDWNVYKRLYVASGQSGYAFYNP